MPYGFGQGGGGGRGWASTNIPRNQRDRPADGWTMKSKRVHIFEYQWLFAIAVLVSACGSGQFLMDSTLPPDATAPDGATPSPDASSETAAEPMDAGEASTAPSSDGAVDATITDAGPDRDASDSAGDAAADADAALDAPACDPTKSPHDDPCVLSNAYGVFVSPGGSDLNPGTPSAPKKSIAAAIALALADNRPRVYLCDGVYSEAVDVRAPVSFYGGLGCLAGDAGAIYLTGTLAQILPPANQVALTIDGVDASVAIEDLALTAVNAVGQDDAGNGLSSVAAFVNASTATFRRCTFLAGSGDHGSDGIAPSNYAGATAPDGLLNDGGKGGEGGSIICADGTRSFGGGGGPTGIFARAGDGGAVPMPMTTPGVDGHGGAQEVFGTCVLPFGNPGANGAAATTAGSPASAIGGLFATGWAPSAGGSGSNGNPGQGGGGGGQWISGGVLGGIGGGAGGCGGAGGAGGGGGGGSIALVCMDSHVDITGCSFVSGAGGNGGRGGDGQQGQAGGSAPDGDAGVSTGCPAAAGGNGGGGAGGAGGTGGVSVCVLFSGAPPLGGASCVTGAAGTPGAGGAGGAGGMNALGTASAGVSSSAGIPGVVQVELGVP